MKYCPRCNESVEDVFTHCPGCLGDLDQSAPIQPYRSEIDGTMRILSDSKGKFHVLMQDGSWQPAEKVKEEVKRCLHAHPFTYCPECVVSPCPLGLGDATSALAPGTTKEAEQ